MFISCNSVILLFSIINWVRLSKNIMWNEMNVRLKFLEKISENVKWMWVEISGENVEIKVKQTYVVLGNNFFGGKLNQTRYYRNNSHAGGSSGILFLVILSLLNNLYVQNTISVLSGLLLFLVKVGVLEPCPGYRDSPFLWELLDVLSCCRIVLILSLYGFWEFFDEQHVFGKVFLEERCRKLCSR